MNRAKVLSRVFPPIEHRLTARDCILFALGIGIGSRSVERADLQFCLESNLKVFPGMVSVIAQPDAWLREPELSIDGTKILHVEQSFTIHRPLEAEKTYVGHYNVRGVVDKGRGKGVLLYLENRLSECAGGELVSEVRSIYLLRGDGGCGTTMSETTGVPPVPRRAPEVSVAIPTLPQAALIFRLSGDYNPIHADPESARAAGFPRPILHGLCTLGVASRALLESYGGHRPESLLSLSARFSAPVFPGETIITESWREGTSVGFQSRVAERDVVVLNHGRAEFNN